MRFLVLWCVFLLACGSPPDSSKTKTESVSPSQVPAAKAESAAGDASAETADVAVTEENWKTHPKVEEIRALVKDVDGGENTRDEKQFPEPCEVEQAISSTLVTDSEGRVRMMESVGGVDVSRVARHYYDESGQLRFLMSKYAHSSAESIYLSRLYLNADGSVLFEPAVEQKSEKAGPGDPDKMLDFAVKTAKEARAGHDRVVAACNAGADACCCWYEAPAGGGLPEFSKDKSAWPKADGVEEPECGGAYFLHGCVNSGICDVAATPVVAMDTMGSLNITLKSGTATVTGSAERVYSHEKGKTKAEVIYYPHPASAVLEQWKKDLTAQEFTYEEVDANTEVKGTQHHFTHKVHGALLVDFEEGCQGSKGTCVWLTGDAVSSKSAP
jgi:hypothetical protein